MKFETFEAIIANLSAPDFVRGNSLRVIRVGENGDCFLNENIFQMLRAIRKAFPNAAVELYNHFKMLRPEYADVIIGESLVDSVFTNIDGLGLNYEIAKKAEFENAIRNLTYFVEQRKKRCRKMPVFVRVLTVNQYVETLRANFNAVPANLDQSHLSLRDDFDDVNELLRRILDCRQDSVTRSWVFLWAERETLRNAGIAEAEFWCPQLARSRKELFVSPEGKLYFCCFDSKQELIFGDLMTTGVCEALRGNKRRDIFNLLSAQQFSRLGGPCKTVHCCQVYHTKPFVSRILRKCIRLLGLTDWSTWRIRFVG